MIVRDRLPLKRIWPATWRRLLILLVFDCTVAFVYSVLGHKWMTLDGLPIAPLASALTIFLAFRTNATYLRWWEARQLWGSLVNTSRALARQYLTMLDDHNEPPSRIPMRNTMVMHQVAFVHALRCHLRQQSPFPELKTVLGEEEAQYFRNFKNVPAAILLKQGELLRQAYEEGFIDTFRWTSIDENHTTLSNIQGACERIKNTPFPKQFEFLPSVLIDAFCWLLPLALVSDLGLLTPIASVLISFTFIAADLMSRELAYPFDNTIHDTPMTALSRTIELNLREQMRETDVQRGLKTNTLSHLAPIHEISPVDGFVY